MIKEQWLTNNFFLLLVVFFAFFCNLWGIPLFDLDEGAFAEATREMLVSGNFAATYLDGVPRYDKPILSYWFQALSVSLFGINEFAFRLPSAIAACFWVYACYVFAREQWNEQTARYAVLFMATTLWIALIGRAAIADAWLNLFISLTMFDIWRYYQSAQNGKPSQPLLLRTYLWMALGMLTKGPVAIAIPFLTSLIVFVSLGQIRLWLSAIFNPAGWLVLIAVMSPWLFMVYQDQGIEFFKGFLLDHNLNRFKETREGHGGQLHYFLLVLPLILLPFTGVLFKAIASSKTFWANDRDRFLLVWFLVVFVLVSLSQTQLPHYVLYGVTGLVLLFAAHRERLAVGNWQLIIPIGFFVLLAAIPVLLGLALEKTNRAYERELIAQYADIFQWPYFVAVAVLIALAVYVLSNKQWSVANRLVAIGFLQTVFIFNVFIEAAAAMQQQPVRNAALFTEQFPERNVVAYKIKMPSFSVYRQKITPRDAPQAGDWVFTRADKLEQLKQEINPEALTIVYQQGGILLVEVADYESNS